MFSCVLGTILAKLGKAGKPLVDLFTCLTSAMMGITTLVIWLSPVGVLFLVTAKILEVDSLDELVGRLGWYFVTVMAGLSLQGFLILPLIYFLFTRKNPVTYLKNLAQAIATAFGTASR